MKRLSIIAVIIWFMTHLVGAQDFSVTGSIVRPLPVTALNDSGITAELLFSTLSQGGVGVAVMRGDDIAEARVLFGNNVLPFVYDADANEWYALVMANIDMQPREYGLTMYARKTDGAFIPFNARVVVESAQFIRQNFAVSSDRAFLIDPEVERNEFARIDAITETITPERLWDANGFIMPMNTEITAGFGQYRILNQSVQTRHTGWDQSAPVGSPVGSIAAGRVAFAGQLDIRGNYVVIDHGWGVYSGYAHLSQINVERGQSITQGQIIGLSGNTGRSSGPHLHWEMVVNREWVDSLAFLKTWLPGPF